jgi:flagellar protein FliJ
MKRFDFRLEPLLNYRKYQERIAQQHTAKAQMDVKDCENQILDLKRVWIENTKEVENSVEKGVSAREFKRYHEYLNSVEAGIAQEESRKLQLKKVLKEKLLELKRKSVDKKAMELYREKLKSVYTQEMLKNEQKELDEISSLKTARELNNESHQ